MNTCPVRDNHETEASVLLLGYVPGHRGQAWRVELELCAVCAECRPVVQFRRCGDNAFPHRIAFENGSWERLTVFELPRWLPAALAEQQLLDRALALWRAHVPQGVAASHATA